MLNHTIKVEIQLTNQVDPLILQRRSAQAIAIEFGGTKINVKCVEWHPTPADYHAEDKKFPRHEWQLAAFDGDTQFGYWEWVQHGYDAEGT